MRCHRKHHAAVHNSTDFDRWEEKQPPPPTPDRFFLNPSHVYALIRPGEVLRECMGEGAIGPYTGRERGHSRDSRDKNP